MATKIKIAYIKQDLMKYSSSICSPEGNVVMSKSKPLIVV